MAIQDRATRLTARVAPYIEAIALARAGGLTWRDIGRALCIQNPDAVRQAVKTCKYKAEQIPLPEPGKAKPETVAAPAPGQSGKKLFDSLPKIGS